MKSFLVGKYSKAVTLESLNCFALFVESRKVAVYFQKILFFFSFVFYINYVDFRAVSNVPN